MGRKIRIAFIGNMNVGKTTLLNCIIGKDILPTDSKENTYRGIIIRHKPGEDFKLYKTELKTKGEGSFEYSYFEDDEIPYRVGVEEIKNYINIKNNDKIIEDKDAYLIITGHLKIFDLIELNKDNKDIISKIEFIDLPGTDREDNEFNKKQYFEKILKFSNCCVYVNTPDTINDENSVKKMIKQYNEDKNKIHILLRINFIKACIFVINKIEELEDKDREKAKNDAVNIISEFTGVEKKDINISLFSGQNYLTYLNIMNEFIYPLENEPEKLFLDLYKEYYLNFFKYISNGDDDFINFIYIKIDEKVGNFAFKQQEDIQDIPEDFKKKIKLGMEQLEKNKYKLFNNKYDEVIKELYNFYVKFKKFDLREASMFFENLKNSIRYSRKFYDYTIEKNLIQFIKDTDSLFAKELKEEKEKEKKEKISNKEKELNELKNITKEKIKKSFSKAKDEIKKFLEIKKDEIKKIIDSELENISAKLKEAKNDLKIAKETFQSKINTVIENIKEEIKNQFSNLIDKILTDLKDINKEFKPINNNIKLFDINTFNRFIKDIFDSLFYSILTIGGFSFTSIIFTSAGIGAGGLIAGPIGLAIGVSMGVIVGLTAFLIKFFRKEKRYTEGLELFRKKIIEELMNFQKSCLDTLQLMEKDINNKIESKIEIIQKDIDNIDKEDWKNIKEKYFCLKQKLFYLLPELKN